MVACVTDGAITLESGALVVESGHHERRTPMRAAIIITLTGLLASTANAETRLLRFPDLHGDTVVVTDAGNLWPAATDGAHVHRLTSKPGASPPRPTGAGRP
jgi:tricorn protease-like protein